MTQEIRDRRQNPDRRNQRSRRRYAEARSLHVELCHSVLRIAVVVESDSDDRPLVRTSTVVWRHDAADVMSEQGRTELAVALGQFVAAERLAGCGVSFAINSTRCINRSASGSTSKVEQEIAHLRDRSQLYLALGPGPKLSAVARKSIDARHEHALVTVANRRTLDLLVEVAESVGLVVEAVESALVALSRLQGSLESEPESSVLLSQLDEDRFELGVSRGGELLLEYRPSADATVAHLGHVVDDHHGRLQRFCDRQHGAGRAALDRMWLIGSEAEVAAANADTETKLEVTELPIEGVKQYWRIEGGSVDPSMGAALGLALRRRVGDAGMCPNLMDEVRARQKKPIRPFLIRAASPLAASLLLAAALWGFNLEQSAELASLRSEVEAARPAELEGKRLAQELHKAAVESEQLRRLVKRTPLVDVGPLVSACGQCLPADVWLKNLKLTNAEEMALEGASYTESGVYDFVRYLEDCPGAREVALRGTDGEQTPNGPATRFQIELNLAAHKTGQGDAKP